jgi:hypothetical protein
MGLMWRVSLVAAVFTLTTAPVKVVGKSSAGVPTVASRQEHPPIIIRERHGKNTTSTNWSGYAVTGTPGSVTDVTASWVVPAIQGTCPATNQYSSFWVGIDGYSSNTVEQIGTDSDCQNGNPVYYAWYEFYPHLSYGVQMTIQPGDTISAEVKAGAKGLFTVTLTNMTSNETFSTSAKMPSAKASSAEWIVEAPYSGGVLPLPNFGTAKFGQRYTSVSNTSSATVGGTTGPIGSFPSNVEITMVDSNGGIKALPNDLTKDGTSFTDSFVSSGP